MVLCLNIISPSSNTARIPVINIISIITAPPIIAFVGSFIGKLKSSGKCKKSAPINTPIVPDIYAIGAALSKFFHDRNTEHKLANIPGRSQ